MRLESDALEANGLFDPRYTGDFDNSSPELRWEEVPEGTVCFALIAEDPDAPKGLFTHWLIYGIPSALKHLPAGIPAQESLPNGIRQGLNDFGKLGYAGPLPPMGDPAHRYVFRLYALNSQPEFVPRLTRPALLELIGPCVIGTAEFVGRYRRVLQQKAG